MAKVKLFQLTPIRYAKSRVEADASFRITDGRCKARGLPAALLGFCSVIPSALRGISTRTWWTSLVELVSNKDSISITGHLSRSQVCRKELTYVKGRCGLLVESKGIALGKVLWVWTSAQLGGGAKGENKLTSLMLLVNFEIFSRFYHHL